MVVCVVVHVCGHLYAVCVCVCVVTLLAWTVERP